MRKTRKNQFSRLGTLLILFFCGILISFSITTEARSEKLHLRLGTSSEGTTAYASGVGLSAVVNKYIQNVSMGAVPTPGSTASVA